MPGTRPHGAAPRSARRRLGHRLARRWVVTGLLAVAVVLSGCATQHRVETHALVLLDDFEAGDERSLLTVEREWVEFDAATPLRLVRTGVPAIERTYVRIFVRDGKFTGTRSDGQVVEVPLDEIAWAEVTTHAFPLADEIGTLALILLLPVIVVLLVVGLVVGLLFWTALIIIAGPFFIAAGEALPDELTAPFTLIRRIITLDFSR